VYPTTDIAAALDGAEIVLMAVPSQHLRSVCETMLPMLRAGQILVSATKGLEREGLRRMSQVIAETIAPRFSPRLAVLSGPTFAREVAHGAPTAVVIASEDEALASLLQRRLAHSALRFYTNTDVIGVEIGGAVKNVIAIAAGICEGLELGSNAVAALVTRGLAEITRLACACGGRRETLYGLAGLGDLVLTCTGASSRNRSAGVELGRGRSLEQILSSTPMVIEGVPTALATIKLAQQKGVEMPIAEQMYAVLYQNRAPRDAVRELMERSLKAE
jgi:glycerol-3-phosphate dehydrogenase (NAD(P)+)